MSPRHRLGYARTARSVTTDRTACAILSSFAASGVAGGERPHYRSFRAVGKMGMTAPRRMVMWETCSCRQLLQRRILRPGCFEDGEIRIGIFPEREELLIGGDRPSTGSIGIRSL
jgi:hypothetical protein